MLPPARLPYILPHPPRLRSPRRSPDEEMVPGLGLAAGAPPALVRVHLPKPQPVGPCRRMTKFELKVTADEGLPHASELGPSETSSRRGPVPPLWSHVPRDPLRRLAGPGSVATLVICERDVSSAYPSRIPSTGASPAAALFAYLTATSLPAAPLTFLTGVWTDPC